MRGLLAIAGYTLKQHIRHRIYLSLILFAFVMLGGSMVLSSLALEEQLRMIMNLGLGAIEFLTLIAVVFLSVNLIVEEIESRSIYLILSHPIERWQYLLGRFTGTLTALTSGILIMAAAHIVILLMRGWSWDSVYLVYLLCAWAKVVLVGSLALFISLATTSTATSMVFTGFLWMFGHFTSELTYMADRSGNFLIKAVSWVLINVSPNFSYFNFRDFIDAGTLPSAAWWTWLVVYAAGYAGTVLLLTSWLMAKREV